MPEIREHCFHHDRRSAVARCPSCGRFYCSECITEHDGRVICAACLAQSRAHETTSKRKRRAHLALLLVLNFLWLWWFFHSVGWFLARIPADYHEGTIWEKDFGDTQAGEE